MRGLRVFSVSLLLMAAVLTTQSEGGEPMPAGSTTTSPFVLPFEGPGQLLAIISRGPARPPNFALLRAARGVNQVLRVESPDAVRWVSPEQMLVYQSGPGLSGKIVRVDRTGKPLEVMGRGSFLDLRVGPDGTRVVVARTINKQGNKILEVRDLDRGFEAIGSWSPEELLSSFGTSVWLMAVWSQDGNALAVSVDSDENGKVYPRLVVVSLDSGTVTRLYDSPEDRKRDESGLIPIFWHRSGIYVRSSRGVQRCDPEGSGCQVAYHPGADRYVVSGTLFGAEEALLLVQDRRPDPLEVRAKEIHRLNLSTGKGELWVRLPDDVFVSDIDWIEEPNAR
jgi:hypothetical protein